MSDKIVFEEKISEILFRKYGISYDQADSRSLYFAISEYVQDEIQLKYREFEKKAEIERSKKVCYLSMEFLLGRSLKNNLFNIGLLDVASDFIKKCGFKCEDVFEVERDAGLGNGGLGRLAASYLDALATLRYYADGYSILYEYGFFKQYFSGCEQKEMPDSWLDTGYPWLYKTGDKIKVKIGGHIKNDGSEDIYCDYNELTAEQYQMYIPGYKSGGVTSLKLWRALSSDKFDFSYLAGAKFDKIINLRGGCELVSMFLYPPDETDEGKRLRLTQQYFFVSATVQSVISQHFKKHRKVDNLSSYISFHINDTHPAICIPELIRVLCEDYCLDFDKAFDITLDCVTYTNHTVMPEALETWSEKLFSETVPPIYKIIKKINKKISSDMFFMKKDEWERMSDLSIVSSQTIRMANLAVLCSNKINGVSELHSSILKNRLFYDFSRNMPERFTNVTNGITYRRWLCQANKRLANLLDDTIGETYRELPYELAAFSKFANDKGVLDELERVRMENKIQLSEFCYRSVGRHIDPSSIFDVQIKRLHEYKRQLLSVLKILTYYLEIINNPNAEISPKTFIFGAKAAPSYHHAKRIIKLINKTAELISQNSKAAEVLGVMFIPDYNISIAEKIIPASDFSEQISLAGKEASGTGNMKFMLNGALTIGTYDGANIEIADLVGEDNIYIFGMRADEVEKRANSLRDPLDILSKDIRLKEVVSLLRTGICGEDFSDIADYLTKEGADPYMCLLDYDSYIDTFRNACIDYKNKKKYYSKVVYNISNSGYFASDRAVEEYSANIWNLKRVKT